MKKTTKKAVKAAAPKARKAAIAAPAAAPAPAPAKGGRKGIILLIFLLLAGGLGLQGYLLWRKDQKSKMIVRFVNQLAPNGRDQNGAFCCARSMTVDQEGSFYVLEEPEVGHRLQKLSAEGKFLALYKPAKPEQAITQGNGLAVSSKGEVFVVEQTTGKVKVLTPDLKFSRSFDIPSHNLGGAVFNSKDELLIADREKSQLLVVDTKGQLLRRMDGGKQRMGGPYRLTVGSKDEVYVLDFARGMNEDPDIKSYDAAGNPLTKWTVRKFPANPYNYIQWHPAGYVVINDNRGNSLAKGFLFYTPEGKLYGTAEISSNRWVLKNISGFVIDPKRGDIFVNTNMIGRGGDRFSWSPDDLATE